MQQGVGEHFCTKEHLWRQALETELYSSEDDDGLPLVVPVEQLGKERAMLASRVPKPKCPTATEPLEILANLEREVRPLFVRDQLKKRVLHFKKTKAKLAKYLKKKLKDEQVAARASSRAATAAAKAASKAAKAAARPRKWGSGLVDNVSRPARPLEVPDESELPPPPPGPTIDLQEALILVPQLTELSCIAIVKLPLACKPQIPSVGKQKLHTQVWRLVGRRGSA